MFDKSTADSGFAIANIVIQEDCACFIIAEAGINHNGDLEMALKLVDASKDAGAHAVKFQKRHLPSLYPQSLLQDPNLAEWGFQYIIPALKSSDLSDSDFERIKRYCDEKGIIFMCTPWDGNSLELLKKLDVPAYKVSSADLVNYPLIDEIAKTGRPMILSTGMATAFEIERTVAHLKSLSAKFALLHCVSAYPAPFESLNLRYIETLKKYGVPVGYSGHERGISVPVVARTLGAVIIEKHITLDRTLPGPDHASSLEPYGFKKMVRDIRVAETALGISQKPVSEKRLCQIELLNRQILRKSLVAAKDLAEGAIVTRDCVTITGPGKGISPQRIDDLLGVVLHRNVKMGECFVEGDLKVHSMQIIDRAKIRRLWGLKSRFHDFTEMLNLNPPLIEMHFTEADLNHTFQAPENPYPQRLIVHAPEFFNQKLINLASRNENFRNESLTILQRTIDKSLELAKHFSGPVGIVMHLGGMAMDETPDDPGALFEIAIEAFRKLKPGDAILMPENLPPRPWYLGGQWHQYLFAGASDMTAFCSALNLKMTLDISHAQLYCTLQNEDLGRYIEECMPFAAHLHIADASGIDGEGLQINEGVIEWNRILPLLASYNFTWLPEIWCGHLNESSGFVEAINRLAEYGVL